MNVIGKFALWTLVAYAGYCAFLFLVQRQVIFPRYIIPSDAGRPPAVPGLERFWVETDFGRVESWYLPPQPPPAAGRAPVVVFAHGNAERIDWMPQELLSFTALGAGVLLVEYPGYGQSQGSPSQRSITEAFVRAYDRITARPDVDPDRMVLFGRSLGGGAVCALAARRPAAALILMSTFTSIRSFAPRYLAPGFLIRDPFDNLSVVEKFPGPVLVLHGRFDEVIPYGHGVALARAAPNGRLLTYDCGHNDFPPGWFGFKREARVFLEAAGILSR